MGNVVNIEEHQQAGEQVPEQTARETRYTPELIRHLCAQLRLGRVLDAICREDPGMPPVSTVRAWVRRDYMGFAAQYNNARNVGIEAHRKQYAVVVYTPEVANHICEQLAAGNTLKSICTDDPGMPHVRNVLMWVAANHDGFAAKFDAARAAGCELMADEILSIADDAAGDWRPVVNAKTGELELVFSTEHVTRSRLRIESRRWLMSKFNAARYGDKQQVDLTVNSDLAKRIIEARKRVGK